MNIKTKSNMLIIFTGILCLPLVYSYVIICLHLQQHHLDGYLPWDMIEWMRKKKKKEKKTTRGKKEL